MFDLARTLAASLIVLGKLGGWAINTHLSKHDLRQLKHRVIGAVQVQ